MMIGLSTGWLYVNGIYSLDKQKKILRENGMNAIEIPLCNENERIKRISSLTDTEGLREFDYKSFHLLDYNNSRNLEDEVNSAKRIVNNLGINTIIIHPIQTHKEYFEKMSFKDTSLAIENMGKDKKVVII